MGSLKHFNYRYFLDYSGGVFQDFWCHIADIVWMSLNPQNLRKIKANGEMKTDMLLYQDQFAQTFAQLMGYIYKEKHPISPAIKSVSGK